MRTVEDRLAALERTGRRWRSAAAVLGVCVLVLVSRGAEQKPPTSEEVRTKMLRVVDAKGETVFLVGTNDAGEPSMRLLSEGKDAISAFAKGDFSTFRVHNLKGKPAIYLSTQGEDATVITSRDKEKSVGAGLGTRDGQGVVTIYDKNGTRIFEKP